MVFSDDLRSGHRFGAVPDCSSRVNSACPVLMTPWDPFISQRHWNTFSTGPPGPTPLRRLLVAEPHGQLAGGNRQA